MFMKNDLSTYVNMSHERVKTFVSFIMERIAKK